MIWSSRERVAIVGCGAVAHPGDAWRAFRPGVEGTPRATASLGPSFEDVATLPAAEVEVDPRLARMASRGARLATHAAKKAIADAGWTAPGDAGFFLGVGASGGSVEDLAALVAASAEERAFSPALFGTAGLRAANPLLAFQLMNNFTLCHAAIATGTAGPNLALFSRGARTAGAFVEAMTAIAARECDRALAGGADSALHPLTAFELRREGNLRPPLAEGAAVFALARDPARALAFLAHAAVAPAGAALPEPSPGALVVSTADAGAPRGALRWPGQALAATPALAVAAALAEIAAGHARRAFVWCGGIDGHTAIFELEAPDA